LASVPEIDEALSLRWRDVDLASGHGDLDLIAGRIKVRRSKTDAGEREVDVLLALREELVELKARRGDPDPDALVFGTGRESAMRRAATAALDAARAAHKAGRTDATRSQLTTAEAAWERAGKESPSNVRRRYLAPAAEDASAALVKAGRDPLPRLTPHSLRRSFASLLVAIGRDPLYVADQLGHVDPGFSLRTYARVVRLRENERAQLKALAGGEATTVADLDRIARSGQVAASHGAWVEPEVEELPTS
jgi:integrase